MTSPTRIRLCWTPKVIPDGKTDYEIIKTPWLNNTTYEQAQAWCQEKNHTHPDLQHWIEAYPNPSEETIAKESSVKVKVVLLE